jgi:hypothetical protein
MGYHDKVHGTPFKPTTSTKTEVPLRPIERYVDVTPTDMLLYLQCGHQLKITMLEAVQAPEPIQIGGLYPCEYCQLEVPTKQRPGDQPLPTVNNERLCHHDLADMVTKSRFPFAEEVERDIMARLDLGVKRYGHGLQPFNGRDFLLDLYEELLDAGAYANGALREGLLGQDRYLEVVGLLVRVKIAMKRRDREPARTAEGE